MMTIESHHERQQMVTSDGYRHVNSSDGIGSLRQFDVNAQYLQTVQNDVDEIANQQEMHTHQWSVSQNTVSSPLSQSIINPSHQEMHPNGI